MAQKPDGKAAKTERVAFTRPAAERIAEVVRQVEAGDRKAAALSFGARVSGGAGAVIKLGTFTGAWEKLTYKVVTLDGGAQTASVLNVCNPAPAISQARTVVFSTVKGTHVAVEIEYQPTSSTCMLSIGSLDLTLIPGYMGGQVQVLGHNADGCLTWHSVYSCE